MSVSLYLQRKILFNMKFKIWLLGIGAASLFSCRTGLQVAQVQPQKNISISTDMSDDAATASLIAPYRKSMAQQMDSKISHTAKELTKTGDNSNLGNLLADYTFEGAADWAKKNSIPQIDAAVINIGGIRSTIGKGDILLKHVYEVMPFENEVVIVKMPGQAMQGLFDYYLKTRKNNPVSHLAIETADGTLKRALISGAELNPAKTYYIATSDYLALGGDNMKFFSQGEIIATGIKMRDLFIEKFRANPEVATPSDIRLIFNDKQH